ncbi:hypothetical protein BRC86_03235 [Halobacteriales archaeon QS_3_64_16]|nr:MAG: hypothetical protein BRC86_03235 [Halobacteriales archaeon QS_3_64_16]
MALFCRYRLPSENPSRELELSTGRFPRVARGDRRFVPFGASRNVPVVRQRPGRPASHDRTT